MDTAFPYSEYVSGKHFIGRKAECILLGNLISQGEHVSIYEPPKSGKTSLIQQTLFKMRMEGKSFTVGEFSCLNIRSTALFLSRLGSTVIRMSATTPDEYREIARTYLGGTHFVFDPQAFAERNEVLSTSWELNEQDCLTLLRFPFLLAADRGTRMILIVDEFQHIGFTEDAGESILTSLAAVIREMAEAGKKNFSFIFSGSMVNAMKELFGRSFQLRRRVERVRLHPVDEREIVDHINKGFLSGGKSLTDVKLLNGACLLMKCNLWYINTFASICNAMTRGYIMEPALIDALNCLIAMHEVRFKAMINELTTHQVNFLKATVDGVTRYSASEVIRKYSLNSSANVKRVKDALCKKEILSFDDADNPFFLDPLFEYWVRKYYFELPE